MCQVPLQWQDLHLFLPHAFSGLCGNSWPQNEYKNIKNKDSAVLYSNVVNNLYETSSWYRLGHPHLSRKYRTTGNYVVIAY